jgi:hypothetical protein
VEGCFVEEDVLYRRTFCMGGRCVEGCSVEGRSVEGRLVERTFCSEGRFVEGHFVCTVLVPKNMVCRLSLFVFPTSLCHGLFKPVEIFFLSLIGKKV